MTFDWVRAKWQKAGLKTHVGKKKVRWLSIRCWWQPTLGTFLTTTLTVGVQQKCVASTCIALPVEILRITKNFFQSHKVFCWKGHKANSMSSLLLSFFVSKNFTLESALEYAKIFRHVSSWRYIAHSKECHRLSQKMIFLKGALISSFYR